MPLPASPPVLLLSPKSGRPALYTALGAVFHLDALTPEDAAVLAEINLEVSGWFGAELKQSLHTAWPFSEAFRPEVLDYIPCYAESLARPDPPEEHDRRLAENLLFGGTYGDFSLITNGASEETAASPFGYRFSSVMRLVGVGDPAVREDNVTADPNIHTCAVLVITVPVSWPVPDFLARITAIASKLRLRWGAAGYTYADWDVTAPEQVDAATYGHARRFVGYDLANYAPFWAEWYYRIRTVNWLTFLGADFVTAIEQLDQKPLASRGEVVATPVGSSLLLRAGEFPEEGDMNRLRMPRAYVEADAMVRPLRASSGLDFKGPRWDGRTTTQWLRRFEAQLP
jgi:hypothetical protein